MSLTRRDRTILLALIPIVVLVGYWFLLLSPKRADLQEAKDARVAAEQRRDAAVQRVATLERARQTFASDYAEVVRLGKAIPTSIDAPSLLVQLDQAAVGTSTDLSTVEFGERQSGIALPAAPAQGQSQGSETAQPEGNAAAGGVAAATGPGQAVEAAGETAGAAEAAQAAQAAQAAPTPTGPEAPASQPTPAALDSVAMTFTFTGTYFDLADFLHRVKRFVFVADDRIFIRGRLLTIDSVTLSSTTEAAATNPQGQISANVTGTVYLTPRSQGATAGATPAGPAPTPAPPAGETARRGSLPTAAVRSAR